MFHQQESMLVLSSLFFPSTIHDFAININSSIQTDATLLDLAKIFDRLLCTSVINYLITELRIAF